MWPSSSAFFRWYYVASLPGTVIRENIARLRNDYVHAGGSGDDLHDMCQFLRGLLARHLNHWIMRGKDLADHAALLAFVKLPPERAKLVSMRETIDRRIAFIDSAPQPQPQPDED